MPKPFVDDVVSPELALVDPDLAACARDALPLRGPTDRTLVTRAQQLSPVDRAPRRQWIASVLALASLAVVSMAGVVLLGVGSDVGDSPHAITSPIVRASGIATASRASGARTSRLRSGTGVRSTHAAPATDAASPVGQGVSHSQPRTHEAVPQPSTRSPGQALAPGVALRPTTLAWPRAVGVSSYDIVLVRNGSHIYTASSASPSLDVPRSWIHDGVRFAIRPEDQVFVWSVVDGRRSRLPVVNGVLALDTTLIARSTG